MVCARTKRALVVLKALKRSPLGLDLYFWLVYRTFTLRAPLTLTWRQIYRQFGAHPANGPADISDGTVTGGLVISPSSPRIPPAQLRLINE